MSVFNNQLTKFLTISTPLEKLQERTSWKSYKSTSLSHRLRDFPGSHIWEGRFRPRT